MKVLATIVPRSSSSVAERERRLWQDLLANAGQWWDNRVDKKSPGHPDFRHKTIREPLWLSSKLKPSWVDARLPALDAPTHATLSVPQLQGHGHLDKMLHMLLCLQDIPTSHGMFWSLASACNEQRSLSHSIQIFDHLVSLNLEAFSLLAEYLVSIFAKCGDVEAALRAFHKLPHRGAFSWTALIFMYVERGESKVALELYNLMQEENVGASERTFVALLQACGSTFNLEKGREIHKDAQRAGMATNAFVVCTIVSMYGKCGSIAEALDTFCEMPNHSVISWTAMMSAFLQQGQEKETLQLYKLMLEKGASPNDRTFVVVLQACGELCRREACISERLRCMRSEFVEIGRALHTDSRRRLCHTDDFVSSALVSMYGKCGRIADAESVFMSRIDQHNIVLWNAMLSAYLGCDLEIKVLQLYAWLLKQCLSLNKRTYAIVIQASCLLAEKEDALIIDGRQPIKTMSSEIVRAIHTDVYSKRFSEDIYVGSALLYAHGKCGNVVEAETVFSQLQNADTVAWTGLLLMYVEAGDANKALHVYKQMQEKNMVLDDVIFVCALQACAESGNVLVCEQIHFALSCASDSIGAAAALNLIHAYGDCTCVESAGAVFNGLHCPNVASWTALVDGYSREGNYAKSLNLFEELKQASLNPDGVCFLLALSACGHTGLLEKGLEYFESMCRDYNVVPEIKHYVSVANLLGRVGDFLKLEGLLSRMAVEPNMAFWLCVLDACQVYGNVKVANWAFNQAVQLDPKEASAYAIMANVYVNAGLWDFVDDLESLGLERGAVAENWEGIH